MNFTKKILFVGLTLLSPIAFSQTNPDPKWSAKYHNEKLTGVDLVRLIDEVNFKLSIIKVDMKTFKTAILQLSPEAYEQINIDSWYLCSTKHDDYFEIWNMYYMNI
jgi:hypothetical protein